MIDNYNICIMVLSVIIVCWFYYTNLKPIHDYCIHKSGYAMQCAYADKDEAADLMHKLDKVGEQFTNYMVRTYRNDSGIRGKMANNLYTRYKGVDSLRETHPNNKEGDTSYTIDKGNILSLCLRSGSGDLHDFETLKFIYLHELCHIAADVYQHPTKFWQLFKILLQEANKAGIYTPTNYKYTPVRYCGKLTVAYNPFFDPALEDIP